MGLHHALNAGIKVIPVFIFDTEILDQLQHKNDRRVDYIHQALQQIHKELKKIQQRTLCLSCHSSRSL